MVKVLKEKIEVEKGCDVFFVVGQKFIYVGKILSDDVFIRDYCIDEKNFVVVMVIKIKVGQGILVFLEVLFIVVLEFFIFFLFVFILGMFYF